MAKKNHFFLHPQPAGADSTRITREEYVEKIEDFSHVSRPPYVGRFGIGRLAGVQLSQAVNA